MPSESPRIRRRPRSHSPTAPPQLRIASGRARRRGAMKAPQSRQRPWTGRLAGNTRQPVPAAGRGLDAATGCAHDDDAAIEPGPLGDAWLHRDPVHPHLFLPDSSPVRIGRMRPASCARHRSVALQVRHDQRKTGPPRSKENRPPARSRRPAAGHGAITRHFGPTRYSVRPLSPGRRRSWRVRGPIAPRSLRDHREASAITAKPPRSPKRRLQPGAPRLPASGLGPATVLLTRRPDFCTGGDCDRPPGGQPDTASELRQCPHTGGTEPKMCQGVGSFPSHQWGDFRDVSAHNAGGVTSMPVSGPLSTRSGTHREGSLNA